MEITARSLAHLLGGDKPLEIEIGYGRGDFLLDRAVRHPERLLIGYETKTKATRLMLQRIERVQARPERPVADLWLSDDDARFSLPRVIGDGRVDIFHILFPDPWWKSQYIVKRLFSPPFVDLLAAKLRPGGLLHFKSDVQEYGELVRYLVEGHGAFEAHDPALGRSHRPLRAHAPRALVPGARQTRVCVLLRAQVTLTQLRPAQAACPTPVLTPQGTGLPLLV